MIPTLPVEVALAVALVSGALAYVYASPLRSREPFGPAILGVATAVAAALAVEHVLAAIALAALAYAGYRVGPSLWGWIAQARRAWRQHPKRLSAERRRRLAKLVTSYNAQAEVIAGLDEHHREKLGEVLRNRFQDEMERTVIDNPRPLDPLRRPDHGPGNRR